MWMCLEQWYSVYNVRGSGNAQKIHWQGLHFGHLDCVNMNSRNSRIHWPQMQSLVHIHCTLHCQSWAGYRLGYEFDLTCLLTLPRYVMITHVPHSLFSVTNHSPESAYFITIIIANTLTWFLHKVHYNYMYISLFRNGCLLGKLVVLLMILLHTCSDTPRKSYTCTS